MKHEELLIRLKRSEISQVWILVAVAILTVLASFNLLLWQWEEQNNKMPHKSIKSKSNRSVRYSQYVLGNLMSQGKVS